MPRGRRSRRGAVKRCPERLSPIHLFLESTSMTNVTKPHIPPLKLRRTPFTVKRRAAGRAYQDAFGRLRKAVGDLFRRPTPRA
jgi:hypothetical protein